MFGGGAAGYGYCGVVLSGLYFLVCCLPLVFDFVF